ncbi:hypothetical protein Tco_1424796, partial [Tanacetum coccineum]
VGTVVDNEYWISVVISVLLTIAFAGLSVLTIGVAYVLGQSQNKAATYALSRVRKYVNEHLTVTYEAVEALEKAS